MSQSLVTLLDEILIALSHDISIVSKEDFCQFCLPFYARYSISHPPALSLFIDRYRVLVDKKTIPKSQRLTTLLRKRAVRSSSGVAVISFLTKFWGCPGQCTYCPTYDDLPKSYVSGEPAVMRAELNGFDTFRQIQNRLRSLEITGHVIDKCDVRVIGGTWSVYPSEYREQVMIDIYDAHTLYEELRESIVEEAVNQGTGQKYIGFQMPSSYEPRRSQTLIEAQERNEIASSRVIGIAIETRPDWITPDEVMTLRRYGVTRVELGFQTTFDEINALTKRGHGNVESIYALRLLKDAGFKVVVHMMQNLPGSDPKMDRESFARIWGDSDFRPDEIKIYPMVITPHTQVESSWRAGEWAPYDDEMLIDLMADLQLMVPHYVRLNRLYRDIPAHEIIAGSTLANLRQLTEERIHAQNKQLVDISHREVRLASLNIDRLTLRETQYDASGGVEYFLEWIDSESQELYSLLRMRIPGSTLLAELGGSALIRELHTFGMTLEIGDDAHPQAAQNRGLGRKLMARAEEIVMQKYPYLDSIAVISGVGVRGYYEMLGYTRDGTYMKKRLSHIDK